MRFRKTPTTATSPPSSRSNNVPLLASVTNGPSQNKMQFNWDGGAFIQDQWRLGNFTVNLGARYDKFNAFVPAQSVPDSNFVKGFSIPKIEQPAQLERLGDANRRGLGRVRQRQDGRQGVRRPVRRGRGVLADRAVQSDLQPPGFAERGPTLTATARCSIPTGRRSSRKSGIGSANFGSPDTVDKQDPDLKRDKNWTYELTGQHELFPRVQVFGGYYRRHFYDLAWTDNLATANFVDANNPGDWIPFTYTGPADSLLPNGGNEAIQMYNLQPGKVSAAQPAAGLPDERARRLPHLQRLRSRLEHQAAEERVCDGQPDHAARPTSTTARLTIRTTSGSAIRRSRTGTSGSSPTTSRPPGASMWAGPSRFTTRRVRASSSRRRTTRRTRR